MIMPIPMFDVALDELKRHKKSLTCLRLACRPPRSQSLQGRRNHRKGALPRWPRRSDDPNSLYRQIGVLSISLTRSDPLRWPNRPRTERPVPGGSFGSKSRATVDLQGETATPRTSESGCGEAGVEFDKFEQSLQRRAVLPDGWRIPLRPS
jgi:hypothetical protein